MVGNRILSADLDNDGYPDLIVNAIGSPERETIPSFWDGGFHNLPDGGFQRLVSVLMNRPTPAGGRMFGSRLPTQETSPVPDQPGPRRPSTATPREGAAAWAHVNNDGNLDVFTRAPTSTGNNPISTPGTRQRESCWAIGTALTSRWRPSPTESTTETSRSQNDWSTSAEAFTDVDLDGHLDVCFEGPL